MKLIRTLKIPIYHENIVTVYLGILMEEIFTLRYIDETILPAIKASSSVKKMVSTIDLLNPNSGILLVIESKEGNFTAVATKEVLSDADVKMEMYHLFRGIK